MWLYPYRIMNNCPLFKETDQVLLTPYLAVNVMNETVASYSLVQVRVILADTSLFQTTSLFEPIFSL